MDSAIGVDLEKETMIEPHYLNLTQPRSNQHSPLLLSNINN